MLRADVEEAGNPKRVRYATSQGFLQALPDRVTVLVDEAVAPENVDAAKAREELAAAQERQKSLTPQTPDYEREQVIVDFANAKLALNA